MGVTKNQLIAKNILVTLYNNSRDTKVQELADRFELKRSTLNWALMRGNFPSSLRAYHIMKKAPLLAENVHTDREYVRNYRHSQAGG